MKHKVDWGPGFRWFHCDACNHLWDETSRDCTSQSVSTCPICNEVNSSYGWKKHYEWETDQSGNLIKGKEYK